MSTSSWLQLARPDRDPARSRLACSAPTSPGCTAAGKAPGRPGLRAGRAASSTASAASTRARAALDRLRASRCSRSASSRSSSSTLLQRLQGYLPLNPTDATAVPPALAFNTAVSFVTNTNWQNYGGESTMSHLTQMAGLDGAELRLGRRRAGGRGRADPRASSAGARDTLGNFWVDLTRDDDPRSCCRSRSCSRSCSSSQGVVQNFHGFTHASRRVAGRRRRRSPAARSRARRRSRSSAERRRLLQRQLRAPVREPEPASRTCSRSASLLMIPFALTCTFGQMVKDKRQGWVAVRGHVRDLARRSSALAMHFEDDGNPKLDDAA